MHGLEEKEVGYIAGTPYVGVEVRMKAGPGDGHRGEFTAWDIKAGKNVWSINEKFPVWSGVLATAGDVVFYGTMDGWFKAVDAKTGWQFKTSSGIIGQANFPRCPPSRANHPTKVTFRSRSRRTNGAIGIHQRVPDRNISDLDCVPYSSPTGDSVNRVSDSSSEARASVQRVAGNFGHALDTSLATQPMTTVGLAAVMGFVLGALWKT